MSVIMIVFLLLRGVAMLMHQPYLGYLSQLLLAVAFFSVTCSCAAERREHHKATSFMAIAFAVAALLPAPIARITVAAPVTISPPA